MAILIGTDEAGYGPNLGPLVIGISAWRVTGDRETDLYQQLSKSVTPRAQRQDSRVAVADSKQLYRPKGDLSQLERGVFWATALRGAWPSSFRNLCRIVAPTVETRLNEIPWYANFDAKLPIHSTQELTEMAISVDWKSAADEQDVQLLALRAALVFPNEFNQQVARYESKGTVLSQTTLDLVADTITSLHDEPIRVVCDKHGGRNKYGALLQPRFGDQLVRVVSESRKSSVYDLVSKSRPIRISFEVGGESFLPSAIASMLAKYLRELSMLAFNEFWQSHLPDLKPTAGYPVDAKRFREQIRSVQKQLDVSDERLWRNR